MSTRTEVAERRHQEARAQVRREHERWQTTMNELRAYKRARTILARALRDLTDTLADNLDAPEWLLRGEVERGRDALTRAEAMLKER